MEESCFEKAAKNFGDYHDGNYVPGADGIRRTGRTGQIYAGREDCCLSDCSIQKHQIVQTICYFRQLKGGEFVLTAQKAGTSRIDFYNKKKKLVRREYVIVLASNSIQANREELTVQEKKKVKSPFGIKLASSLKKKVEITYASSNSKVARINKNGRLIAGNISGTATIKARITYRGITIKKFKKKVVVYGGDLLRGKTIIGIGDSLLCAHKLGKKYSWLNLLGQKYGMKTYNFAKSGIPLAKSSIRRTPMVQMCREIWAKVKKADYIVILGGANDRRQNVPVGNINDSGETTFCGALNRMLTYLKKKYPKAKIICMTNYARHPEPNNLGLYELDYVNAMLNVCRKRNIPCFDNYHKSGVNFSDRNWVSWGDEGIYLGKDMNYHFSPAAYKKLLPIYETYILKTIAKG